MPNIYEGDSGLGAGGEQDALVGEALQYVGRPLLRGCGGAYQADDDLVFCPPPHRRPA